MRCKCAGFHSLRRNQSATHSASEISIYTLRRTNINEMRDSKQGEGGAISCICSRGCARHNVITFELTGVAPKLVDRFGNGTVTAMAQFVHVHLLHSSNFTFFSVFAG